MEHESTQFANERNRDRSGERRNPRRAIYLAWVLLLLPLAPATASCVAPRQGDAEPRLHRVGFLGGGMPQPWHDEFEDELVSLGYAPGRDLVVERRYALGKAETLPALAAELIDLGSEIIVAADSPSVIAVKEKTRSMPIVMATAADPVGQGFIASLARPGGNITGIASMSPELSMKRLEVLKEAVPGLSDVAVFWDPSNSVRQLEWEYTESAARQLSVRVHPVYIGAPEDLEPAFARAVDVGAGAIMVFADQIISTNYREFLSLAAAYRMPTVFEGSQWVQRGGMVSYGPSIGYRFRRSAAYVDRILKGADPATLPVEQPTQFELGINVKTAADLGFRIPRTVLERADLVIE